MSHSTQQQRADSGCQTSTLRCSSRFSLLCLVCSISRDELRSISGNAMVESIKSGGKPYTTPSGLSQAYTSQALPASRPIHATTLDDREINLPQDCNDKLATFIAVGFNQQAMVSCVQAMCDAHAASPLFLRTLMNHLSRSSEPSNRADDKHNNGIFI